MLLDLLLFLLRWHHSGSGSRRRTRRRGWRCGIRRGGGSHGCGCGRRRRRCRRGSHRRERRIGQYDRGVMPMAVLDGPHLSRRNLTGWLRCGRELLLGRCNDLRLRYSARGGRCGLLRRDWTRQDVSACRSDDYSAGGGQRDHQPDGSLFFCLCLWTGGRERLLVTTHAGKVRG
jgi:hypothetical protein